MIIEKRWVLYILMGLFCIPVLAGENGTSEKSVGFLERYWLISSAIEKQGCPKDVSKKIGHIACNDDVIKIEWLVKRINPDLFASSTLFASTMTKQFLRLNGQQKEGQQCLIENEKYRKNLFTQDQYEKMKTVSRVFKVACNKQSALVEISESAALHRDRMDHLMLVPILFIATGTSVGGAALICNSLFSEEHDICKVTIIGAGFGAVSGFCMFGMNEMNRLLAGPYPRYCTKKKIFEPLRMLRSDAKFIKEVLDREKERERSVAFLTKE